MYLSMSAGLSQLTGKSENEHKNIDVCMCAVQPTPDVGAYSP